MSVHTVQERKGFQSEEGEEREPIAKITSTQKSKTHKPAGPVNLRQKVPEPSPISCALVSRDGFKSSTWGSPFS